MSVPFGQRDIADGDFGGVVVVADGDSGFAVANGGIGAVAQGNGEGFVWLVETVVIDGDVEGDGAGGLGRP